MAENLYQGSDGVRTRIYGYAEGVPSVTPPLPPAVIAPNAQPVNLTASVFYPIVGVLHGATFYANAVDEASLDVSGASVNLGTAFTFILLNTSATAKDVHVKLSTAETRDLVIGAGDKGVILEFKVLQSGFVGMTQNVVDA